MLRSSRSSSLLVTLQSLMMESILCVVRVHPPSYVYIYICVYLRIALSSYLLWWVYVRSVISLWNCPVLCKKGKSVCVCHKLPYAYYDTQTTHTRATHDDATILPLIIAHTGY
eukprot:GHVQ01014535.1.p1 GENE.GHVQ01014535.1~~GHVQ01014535.1.p1  ORF type:complete len:113 (-),score=14.20 GHVQ01014535.1:441-779(-)